MGLKFPVSTYLPDLVTLWTKQNSALQNGRFRLKQTSAELKPESDAGETDAKVKNDVVDLDGLQVSAEVTDSETEIHSGAWIAVQDITLAEDDKQAVIDGKMLQNQHINCAQRLLNQQFPLYMDFSPHSYKASQSKDY